MTNCWSRMNLSLFTDGLLQYAWIRWKGTIASLQLCITERWYLKYSYKGHYSSGHSCVWVPHDTLLWIRSDQKYGYTWNLGQRQKFWLVDPDVEVKEERKLEGSHSEFWGLDIWTDLWEWARSRWIFVFRVSAYQKTNTMIFQEACLLVLPKFGQWSVNDETNAWES